MKIFFRVFISSFIATLVFSCLVFGQSSNNKDALKIVIIRHGEKPEKGGNLNCKGLNRSLQLPAIIEHKFGVPAYTYVPKLEMKERTSHARMFETVTPLAVKYNLAINSGFDEKDSTGLAADILKDKGVVLVVWEHKAITGILHALDMKDAPKWSDNDFDSIWIITFVDGRAVLTKDVEGLNPSDNCP